MKNVTVDKYLKRVSVYFLAIVYIILNCFSMVHASEDDLCQDMTQEDNENKGVDYNRYIYSHGFFAYLERELALYNRPQIQFMNCNEENPVIRNCIRPNCDHKGAWCSSYLQDFNGLYASNGYLYNIELIDDQYVLRRMDPYGENRETVLELSEMNKIRKENSGIEFKYQLFQDKLALELTTKKLGKRITKLLLYDLKSLKEKPILVYDNSEQDDYYYRLGSLYESKILYSELAANAQKNEISLWIYDIETEETHLIREEWILGAPCSIEGDLLYWFDPSAGFNCVSLEDFSETCYREADPSVEYGPSAYDGQYLYLTNSLPPLNAMLSLIHI